MTFQDSPVYSSTFQACVNPDMVKSSNSFHASGDFCHLLITFANSLDPDQERQNVGPDLGQICLAQDGVPS